MGHMPDDQTAPAVTSSGLRREPGSARASDAAGPNLGFWGPLRIEERLTEAVWSWTGMGSGRKKRSTVLNLALVSLAGLAGFALYRLAKRTRIELHNQHLQRGKCIIILGAGFAGRHAAIELAQQLPHPGDGDVILVDDRAYLLYTPMLTEAAGGELDPHHIVSPVHRLPSRVTFLQARVEQVDLRERRVTLRVGDRSQGIPEATRVLQADQLVLALGSVTDYHGIPGLQEHSLGMKDLQDAVLVRNRVLAMLERASDEEDPVMRRALLTVVVGGGGYTGLETMAALNDLSASQY